MSLSAVTTTVLPFPTARPRTPGLEAFRAVLRYGRGMTLTNGNALAGRLAKLAFDLGVSLWLSSPAKELIVKNGTVKGAIVEKEGKPIQVTAQRAVVLACGGLPAPLPRRPAGRRARHVLRS
jgi:phytoene dehydrogenase-like protein